MFDDLEDIEEFRVDPQDPASFSAELLAAAEAGNAVREKMVLGALDDGLEAAVHAAGKGAPGSKKAFAAWLQLLLKAIAALAEKNLEHFIWEAPGRERAGAALVRRLQSTVNSGTFDSVKVEPPLDGKAASGLVLMLGRGGTTFDDLAAPEEYWRKLGYTVIRANHCCIQRLKEREMDRILQALVDQGISRLGVIGHFFSENGSYFWCHIMERWGKCPPAGLPPLEEALRGCIYDSCHSFAGPMNNLVWNGARGDMDALQNERKGARRGPARHVTMNAALAMARNVFGPEDERTLSLADVSGPIFKGIVDVHAHRGSRDDPIFNDNGSSMIKGHMREPASIPRIVFVSQADVTLAWQDCVQTVAWMEEHRGATVELMIYEKPMNCSMHRDDPTGYFGRVDTWQMALPEHKAASDGVPGTMVGA